MLACETTRLVHCALNALGRIRLRMQHNPYGSLWHRWDLHFHTPSSFDYPDKQVTDQQIVDRLVAEGIRVVAVTDHHTIDVGRIRNLQKIAGERLTVLP